MHHDNTFTPIKIGDLRLPNRIFMSPLTRSRATEDHLPRPDLMAKYYRQRATAGLILSEAIPVDPMGVGYARVPGIWSKPQVEAWKPITGAVHAEGGTIFGQLWHVGRISHSRFLKGRLPVAPSAIRPAGHVSLVRPITLYETPRALALAEVRRIAELFNRAARFAKEAGFDGVELHGANGYLLDQFLQSSTNVRSDEYGGSIENRARLLLECTDAAIQVFGPGRVGMHLSPRRDLHDMGDSDPAATFGYVARELGKRAIAFIMSRERLGADSLGLQIRKEFGGTYVVNEDFDLDMAEAALESGIADAVGFGRLFIANPDLPKRFAHRAPLNALRPEMYYAPGEEGYVDYPQWNEVRRREHSSTIGSS